MVTLFFFFERKAMVILPAVGSGRGVSRGGVGPNLPQGASPHRTEVDALGFPLVG